MVSARLNVQTPENEVCFKALLSCALDLVPGRIRQHLRRVVFATIERSTPLHRLHSLCLSCTFQASPAHSESLRINIRTMKYTYAALALAAGAAATPASEIVTRDPTPSSFKITNVVYGGSGCPQGSIDIKWNDSRVFPISA